MGGGSSDELGSGESKAGSSSSKEGSGDKQGDGRKDGSGGREGREDSGGNDSPPIPDTSEFGFSWTELYEVRDELMAWKERVAVEWAVHAHRAPRLAACSLRVKGWCTTMSERRLVCWQQYRCGEVAKVGAGVCRVAATGAVTVQPLPPHSNCRAADAGNAASTVGHRCAKRLRVERAMEARGGRGHPGCNE